MRTKKKLLSAMILMACGSVSTQTYATLPTNAVLTFDAGVASTYGKVLTGSYFGMDTNGDGVIKALERTAIAQNAGLAIGKSQSASGTHTGAPNGSEFPGLDSPWNFFGNTGLHKTTSNVDIINDDTAGGVTLDFSGWAVTWNGIDTIVMANRAHAGNPDGVAILTCASICAQGETYTLDYSATVPGSDPNFANVKYNTHLEGTIEVLPAPTTSATAVNPGTIAASVLSADGYLTYEQLLSNGGTIDNLELDSNGDPIEYRYAGGLTDFVITGATTSGTEQIVIPLLNKIPVDGIYRKFNVSSGTWSSFVPDGTNLIASATATTPFNCPAPGDVAYNHTNGLVEGDDCIQITILEGGAYDDDTNGTTITDPGGVTSGTILVIEDNRVSSTDGCSMSGTTVDARQRADWWLVAGFMGLLGLFKLKRKRS